MDKFSTSQKIIKYKLKKILVWGLLPLFLLFLNVFLVRQLYVLEYTNEMGSIESAFLADARFISQNWGHLTWQPAWYLGFPFRFFYPPLFHYLVAGIHSFSQVSIPIVYHFITALFYSLGGLSLYFFVRYLTKRILPAFLASLMFSLLPLIELVIPTTRYFSGGYAHAPWRLIVLLLFGEGPHVSILSLLPLVLLLFLWALRNPSFKSYLIACISTAFILLSNWPSSISLVIALFALITAEILRGQVKFKIKRSFLILFTAYGFSAFWLTFSYVYTTFVVAGQRAGGGFLQTYLKSFPVLVILFPVLIGLWFAFFGGKHKRFQWSFIVIYTIIFSIIVLPSYLKGFDLIPEANRFLPELNMGVAIFLAFIVEVIYNRFKKKGTTFFKTLGQVFVLIVIGLVVFISWPFIIHSGQIIKSNPDITRSVEYQIASWLQKNTSGKRVYATGSIAFWLNAWTDVPQVRGGSDQGATNPWFNHASYQINTSTNVPYGQDGPLAILWLRAFNVSYLVFNGPGSREVFHDFVNPTKFEGLLEEVYNKQGDVIYKIPLENPSLAQVVDYSKLKSLSPPKNATDEEAIGNYVEIIDSQAKSADFKWLNNQKAEVEADLIENEAIALQITYHAGWRAYSDDRSVPIKKDGLGFMILNPGPGIHKIILKHDLAWDEFLGYIITFLTIVIIIYFRIRRGKKWLYAKENPIQKKRIEDE